MNRTTKGVDEDVARQLQNYSWPGNVGELERVVKRACIVASSDVITADDIRGNPGRQSGDAAQEDAVKLTPPEKT